MAKSKNYKIDASKIRKNLKVASSIAYIHVIPQKDRWVVKREGAYKHYGTFSTKSDAIVRARSLAKKVSVNDILVHRKDATIEKWEKAS